MKISKWLSKYYDYLFDVKPHSKAWFDDGRDEEGAEGIFRAMPLFVVIIILGFALIYFLQWFFKTLNGNSFIE
jgi:hypothetical protein